MVENLIFLGAFAIFNQDHQFIDDAAKIVAIQIVWAICTGPIFLMIFKNTRRRLDTGFKALYARKGEQS